MELHEAIRKHSLEAAKRVKQEGLDNDLMDRIAKDPQFGMDAKAMLRLNHFVSELFSDPTA